MVIIHVHYIPAYFLLNWSFKGLVFPYKVLKIKKKSNSDSPTHHSDSPSHHSDSPTHRVGETTTPRLGESPTFRLAELESCRLAESGSRFSIMNIREFEAKIGTAQKVV
jgi:hypothetical protein